MISLLIAGLISYSLYKMVVLNDFSVINNEKAHLSFCLIFPLILTPLPLFTNSYGESKGWCWIQHIGSIEIFWMILEFYGLLILMILLNIYIYLKIYWNLKDGKCLSKDRELIKKFMNRVKWYPIIMVVCYGTNLFHRIYYIIYQDANPILDLISGNLGSLVGFINTIAYGITETVRASYAKAIRKWFGRSKSSLENNLVNKYE
jgi:hypothetical protein